MQLFYTSASMPCVKHMWINHTQNIDNVLNITNDIDDKV